MPNPGLIRMGQSPKNRIAKALGESLGKGIGEFTSTYAANKDLDKVIEDPRYKDAPLSERASMLERALSKHGEKGAGLLQKRLGIEQQAEKEFVNTLIPKLEKGEELSPKELKRLPADVQQEHAKIQAKKKEKQQSDEGKKSLMTALEKAGVPEEEREVLGHLYDAAPVGGKTDVIKSINEAIKRGKLGDYKNKGGETEEEENPYYNFPKLKEEEGLTEGEKVKRYDAREARNAPIYNEVYDKLKGYENELRALDRIEQLNPLLPKGVEKWNVNPKNGELILPAAATPETQLFIKTINDFTVKAKESFPGRVTNFDLQTFLRRLPTLANSAEGRTLIIKQMQLSNQIANLKEETLKETYDHYGTGNISNSEAKKIADKAYKEKKGELEARLKNLDGMLDSVEKDSKIVKLYHPKTGVELSVPANEVEELVKKGALREPRK